MLLGYARISKTDGSQLLDLQCDALLAAGVHEVDFFAEDPERYEEFKLQFTSQRVIDDVIDDLLEQHGAALKLRDGEERDLSRLVAGFCFAKAYKTFHATQRLCALGFGEDAPYC